MSVSIDAELNWHKIPFAVTANAQYIKASVTNAFYDGTGELKEGRPILTHRIIDGRLSAGCSVREERMMSELLVVEDEANIRRFVASNLIARGFKVIEVGDAEEGLRRLRDKPPQALILDIRLPNMSGWDLLEAIADEPALQSLPVIVMTASATNIKFGESHYTNVVQWLVKPISASDLVRAVKKALEL